MWAAEYMQQSQIAKKSYVVCGDDLAALWTRHEINTYKKNLLHIGLELNQTKTIESRNLLLFCESYYQIIWRHAIIPQARGHIQNLSYIPDSVRFIPRPRLSAILAPSLLNKGSKQLSEIEQLRGGLKEVWPYLRRWQKPVIESLLWSLHRSTFAKCLKLGFSLGAPRELGGIGLPFGPITEGTRILALESLVTKRFTPSSKLKTLWLATQVPQHISSATKWIANQIERLPTCRFGDSGAVPLSAAIKEAMATYLTVEAMDLRESKQPIPMFTMLQHIAEVVRSQQKQTRRLPILISSNGKPFKLPSNSTIQKLSLKETDTEAIPKVFLETLLEKIRLPKLSLNSGNIVPDKQPAPRGYTVDTAYRVTRPSHVAPSTPSLRVRLELQNVHRQNYRSSTYRYVDAPTNRN